MSDDIIDLESKRKEREEKDRIVYEFEVKENVYADFLKEAKEDTSNIAKQILFSTKNIFKRLVLTLLSSMLFVVFLWFCLVLTVDSLDGLDFQKMQALSKVAYLISLSVLLCFQVIDIVKSRVFIYVFHEEATRRANDFMLDRSIRRVIKCELQNATN